MQLELFALHALRAQATAYIAENYNPETDDEEEIWTAALRVLLGEPTNETDPRRPFLFAAVTEMTEILKLLIDEGRNKSKDMDTDERGVFQAMQAAMQSRDHQVREGVAPEDLDNLWDVVSTYLVNVRGGIWDASRDLMYAGDEEE